MAGTVASLTDYHAQTCAFFDSLQKARERRALRCHRLSRPTPIKSTLSRRATKPIKPRTESQQQQHSASDELSNDASDAADASTSAGNSNSTASKVGKSSKAAAAQNADYFEDLDLGVGAGSAFEEEIKQENTALFKEMSTIGQEVDQTTQKVGHPPHTMLFARVHACCVQAGTCTRPAP